MGLLKRTGRFVSAHALAIGDDPVLRRYAWMVLAGHAITWAFFVDTGMLWAVQQEVEPFCWPYFESCWQYRLEAAEVWLVQIALAVLLVVAAERLLNHSHLVFWLLLLTANASLFTLMSLDYRLRANELYMLFWLNAVFLFWPKKRWAVPLLVISFYLWAGVLKLNREWLSGAGFTRSYGSSHWNGTGWPAPMWSFLKSY